MRQRALYLMKFYVATMLVFMAAKCFFMLYHQVGHSFTIADVCQVIRHGFTMDLSTSLYFLIVPFLVVVASLWLRVTKWVLYVYNLLTAFLLSLAFVVDTSLYEFWLFKLDATCLQYLDTPTEAMASVSTGYILVRLCVILLWTVVLYWCYRRLTPSVWIPLPAIRHRVLGSVIALLFIPLIVIGIRGGLDETTTNLGQAYFSQDLFLNHSAVNPVFSFFSSFENAEKDYDIYHFFDEATCEGYLENVYNTDSRDVDSLLTTKRPNVIIVLMEGCGSIFTEVGGRGDVMPNLNRLAREGIYFTACYGNSWRTDRGTVCTLSGWPSFPNVSVMKMPDKSQTMPSVARTLRQRGYHTRFLYGGDINFTEMRSYLLATGWDRLHSKEDYSISEQESANWGVRDDITFGTLAQMATTTPQPFLIAFSTLSSHEPWDVPIHEFDDEVLNAFHYLDRCIGNFVQQMKKSGTWDHTLIVLLPDHGIAYKGMDETNLMRNLIPVVWTGGVVKSPRTIDKLCNQSDVIATLLGQLGIPHDDFTFSRDVLSSTYRYPFAVHNYNNAQFMIDSTGHILYDFDAGKFLVRQSTDADRMLLVNKAILQKTAQDLKER